MNAIIPLNIAAVRVNANDYSQATAKMKGRTALFEDMPYQSGQKKASTGDKIYSALEAQSSPANPLGPGVHLHWELPDFFRSGVQPSDGSDIRFPPAPNRWLIIRYFSLYDAVSQTYAPVISKSWIVESDFLHTTLLPDPDGVLRPAVSVPVSVSPPQPYAYMGRKLDYSAWDPSQEKPQDFLPYYGNTSGIPSYLTSIGFVGPSFAGYYPECSSVFGYWDRFEDLTDVGGVDVCAAVAANIPLQFRAVYQAIGWIDSAAGDPLAGFDGDVRARYQALWQQCHDQGIAPTKTPAEVAAGYADSAFRWAIDASDIPYTVDKAGVLQTLTVPGRTLCAGHLQEVVWDMLDAKQKVIYFLSNPDSSDPAVWKDDITVSVGNTQIEALSALLKYDLNDADTGLLDDYEFLLDAFQLGLLTELEQSGNLFDLEEALHQRGFAHNAGGYSWIVTPKDKTPSDQAPNADQEVTLPLELAEQLHLLNLAQKEYDQRRAQLLLRRKQLFMDWIRYVKSYVGEDAAVGLTPIELRNFLAQSKLTGELAVVVQNGAEVGLLQYEQSSSDGQILRPLQPAGSASCAYAVWKQYAAVVTALLAYPQWTTQCAPVDPFWSPTDLVTLMEGKRIEPVRRNGTNAQAFVRLSSELLEEIGISYQGKQATVTASSLSGLPTLSVYQPMRDDVARLVGEAALLAPMLAELVAAALEAQNDPIPLDKAQFAAALETAQGGLSPLDPATDFTAVDGSLFAAVRSEHYVPASNPVRSVSSPQIIDVTFTFTSAAATAYPPSYVGWNTQQAVPEFNSSRCDPFLPVFMIWEALLDPLARDDAAAHSYTADNVTRHFALDADAIDYRYPVLNHAPKPFTLGTFVPYSASVVLSKKPVYSLTAQVESYLRQYPQDPYAVPLKALAAAYAKRHMLSQTLNGFNAMQTLRRPMPKVSVQDLTQKADPVTPAINTAAQADPLDNWYSFDFNGEAPVATGTLPLYNFGPLRAGFAGLTKLELVDVFGQRMQLRTKNLNSDGTLQVIPAFTVRPMPDDTVDASRLYLPPRVLAPTRLWFRWLSARHASQKAGFDADFVEMTPRPSTSPIFGWIVPNHLDNSLFFYDDDGAAIGSFGLEHGALVYRTRAGHFPDSLTDDIGPPGKPKVNPHLAAFLWFVNDHLQGAKFLSALMTTIQDSEVFLNSPDFAQDAGVAILIGKPLALARVVVSLETAGGVLPLSQADTAVGDPFPQDVLNSRYDYLARQTYSAAALDAVQFPLRLGDLSKANDGMIGYLPEGPGTAPYSLLYAPAAPEAGGNGIVRPEPDTLQLQLNMPQPLALTLLFDPRAAIHATTGVLPVAQLAVPSDQYARIMRQLAVTFATHPILQRRDGLVVPLPAEPGYSWSWVQPQRNDTVIQPLAPQSANETTVYGYTPQTLLEGWLRLEETPAPKAAITPSDEE